MIYTLYYSIQSRVRVLALVDKKGTVSSTSLDECGKHDIMYQGNCFGKAGVGIM